MDFSSSGGLDFSSWGYGDERWQNRGQDGQQDWGHFSHMDGEGTSWGDWVSRPDNSATTYTPWSMDLGGANPGGFMGGKSIVQSSEGDWQVDPNFDPFGYRTNKDQAPELSDFFNTWNQQHMNQYGTAYNRPWGKHGESNLRDMFGQQYNDAISEYNQLHGTNLSPNQQALGQFQSAPTEWAATDPSSQKRDGFGNFLKTVAPIGLSMFGAPWLSGVLGGGLAGSLGAGGIIGGASSAISGGNPLTGALSGMAGAGIGNLMGIGGGAASGGSGWTSGYDLPMGNTAGLGQMASGVPDSFWRMIAGGEGVSGLGDMGSGGGSMDFDWSNVFEGSGAGGDFDWSNVFEGPGQAAAAGSGWTSGYDLPMGNTAGLGQSPNFMSQIQNFLSQPSNLMRGGAAIVNMLNQNRTSGQMGDIAERAAFLNQSLNQPQRAPYQQQLAQQIQNPSQFMQTNPVIQAQLEMAKNQMEANTAKMGAGGKVFGDYLQHQHNIMSDNYYKNADLLSRLGGFADGAGGAGSAFGGPATAGANAGANALSGFAQFFNPPVQQDAQIQALLKRIDEQVNQIFL